MQSKKILIGLLASRMKEPATQAVAAAESLLATVKGDAAKYLPNDLQSVEATMTSLKESLAKGDYKVVMDGAPALTTSLNTLKEGVAAKAAEAQAATMLWGSFAADLPNMVSAIESRVGVLSSARRLPAGLDQAGLASAKSGLEMMKSTWVEASTAFTSGNAIDAVTKAKDVKAKGDELLKLLGMNAG
jgi:hypothetical protein